MSKFHRVSVVVLWMFSLNLYISARDPECPGGFYGPPKCIYKCSTYCSTEGCQDTSGVCVKGCVSGRAGLRCNRRCRRFRYGPNCVHACGHCASDQPCSRTSGKCPGRCVSGWMGPRCDQGCDPFWFGDGCKEKCGHCRYGTPCNQVTGVCNGGCDVGWRGPRCNIECGHGTHGVDCTLTCAQCRDNTTCHHVSARCEAGCEDGWTGDTCHTVCETGRFGTNCTQHCGSCEGGSCGHVTGLCGLGCVAGWTPPSCLIQCPTGTHGANCTQRCGHCRVETDCDVITGACTSGCLSGWAGMGCKTAHISSSPSTHPNSNLILPGLVITLVVITCLLLGGVCYHLRVRKKKRSANIEPLTTITEYNPEATECNSECVNTYEPLLQSNVVNLEKTFDLDKSNFHMSRVLLGNGHMGKVRRGYVEKSGEKVYVAIKSLKESASDTDRVDFLNELNILKRVGSHANVVCLVGSIHLSGVLYVALEYASNGDLRTYLRNSRLTNQQTYTNMTTLTSLSSHSLLQLAVDTACGMTHLASLKVIHRDLAARNILLDSRLTAKVADFGMSRHDDLYVKTSLSRVPVRWMAIESLFSSQYSIKSDVWSFGVLLWEIVSLGGTPYPGLDAKQLYRLLRDGHRMSMPVGCNHALYTMMCECWAENPDDRPHFHELERSLSNMARDLQDVYMNMENNDESIYSVIDLHLEDKVMSPD